MPGLDRYGKEEPNPHYDKDLDEFIKETKLELESRKGLYCSPRESLHGGRTSNIKFAYEAKKGESLLYYDFTSLYPYVLANNVFPMGLSHYTLISLCASKQCVPHGSSHYTLICYKAPSIFGSLIVLCFPASSSVSSSTDLNKW